MIQGSPAYENWKAWQIAPPEETGVTFEYPLYSDADGVHENRTDFGPYQILRTVREVPTLSACPSLILRISQVKRHNHPELAGSIESEIASLLSILSGTRIFSSPGYTRVWGSDDPLGTPIYTHEPIIVPKPPLGSGVLPETLTYRSFSSELSICYPKLTPAESLVIAKAARLYQHAIWYAEDNPEYCWLMLVSVVETVAGHWSKSNNSPVDRLRLSRPKLAEMLVEAGGAELLEKVAAEMADYMGATKKFIDFLIKFGDLQRIDGFSDLSKREKSEMLSKVYSYRSRALHGGVAIPAQTVVSLQDFENLVRSASLNWWMQAQLRTAELRPQPDGTASAAPHG